MKKEILDLIGSTNRDDVILGCIIALKTYSQEELHTYLHAFHKKCRFPITTLLKYNNKHIIVDRSCLYVGKYEGICGIDNNRMWYYKETIDISDNI